MKLANEYDHKEKMQNKILENGIEKVLMFIKAQLSAFLGGMVDYLIIGFFFFTEIFHLHLQ